MLSGAGGSFVASIHGRALFELSEPYNGSRPGRSRRGNVENGTKMCMEKCATGDSDSELNLVLESITDKPLRLAVICGGPSEERGISLNSARSVLDHLQATDVVVSSYFLDRSLNAFAIPNAQMYSNTPADFDFKLDESTQSFASHTAFLEHLRETADIVVPALHGKFGEDGGIQALLEKAGLPFVGTGAVAAAQAFDKHTASVELTKRGFATLSNFLYLGEEEDGDSLQQWFESEGLSFETGRVVVKPARAGSSIGVSVAFGVEEASRRAQALIDEGIDSRVVIELFAEGGREFTAIVLDGREGSMSPITLLPTEVELRSIDGSNEDSKREIFNYRRKYLPTRQVSYHTPPRFPPEVLAMIRKGAALLFRELGLRDFARVDGWYLPPSARINGKRDKNEKLIGECEHGYVVFSDINIMSGMEQTSFLFQQAAQVGLSHSGVLRWILRRACMRYEISLAERPPTASNQEFPGGVTKGKTKSKQRVWVLFGGETSERQVSLMSGTNVWLKLQSWPDLEVEPFLLTASDTTEHDMLEKSIWSLPYASVLRHTVEEVVEGCEESLQPEAGKLVASLQNEVTRDLYGGECDTTPDFGADLPKKSTLREWLSEAEKNKVMVFLAVHGGIGEDGTLQKLLEEREIPFTGSDAEASRLCIDKVATAEALTHLSSQGIYTAAKRVVSAEDFITRGVAEGVELGLGNLGSYNISSAAEEEWEALTNELKASALCVKPASDGCSTGVARLSCAADLAAYFAAIREKLPRLLPGSLSKLTSIVEMPLPPPSCLLLEPFIETDPISNSGSKGLQWSGLSRWVEVTVGVLGNKGEMRSFSPSITVKETENVLSLEEKFQGGTGVNLTPPPPSIVRKEALAEAKRRVALVAASLGLDGFARIDAFLHADTGEIIIIEANTVPGMTPSTVLFHQALAEDPPIYPRDFFRILVDHAVNRFSFQQSPSTSVG